MADNLIQRILRSTSAALGGSVPSPVPPITAYQDWPRWYQMMLDYYENTGLYDSITSALYGQRVWSSPMRGLRNPASRLVEFYASHVWPGEIEDALPITGATGDLKTAIDQFWTWSNLKTRKSKLIRSYGIYGDAFWKVAQPEGKARVYIEEIDPRMVTDLQHDERNFVTKLRIDDEKMRISASGTFESYWRTEIWSKDTQSLRVWEQNGPRFDVEIVPPLLEVGFDSWGVNFVPIVWSPFLDIGEDRGIGAFGGILDKINEVNQAATRLHQMLFRYNRPYQAITTQAGTGANRLQLPPVRIAGRELPGRTDAAYMGDDDILSLPSGADVKMMVPNIDYTSALAVLNAQMLEIEHDRPELLLNRLSEMGDTSGRSIRYFMAPAIKRVEEVRTNGEDGLIRVTQMAMTIGAHMGILPDLGTFEQGDFEFGFESRDVIELGEIDQAQIAQDLGQAATYWQQIGVKGEVIAVALGKQWGFKAGDVEEPKPVASRGMPTNTPQPKPADASGGA